jgi:hypothetical protein
MLHRNTLSSLNIIVCIIMNRAASRSMTPRLLQAHNLVGHHVRKGQKRGVQVTDFGQLPISDRDASDDGMYTSYKQKAKQVCRLH